MTARTTPLARVLTGLLLGLALVACGPLPRLDATPAERQQQATVLGSDGLRYWGADSNALFIADADESYRRELAAWQASGHDGPLPPASFLAISGGGENGAFGAGLLVGWTERGDRPVFKGVTGISTGALSAPFAFLGPAYDSRLREVYTEISAADVLLPRSYLAALTSDAAADTEPLRRTVARYFDQAMLDAIAAEDAKGRILLIGTTNLDARRPIIWNITKIAASGRPGALELVHEILVASAAIPGAFPPIMIDVELDGTAYQEMHVDGGASAQVFLYPPSLDIAAQDARLGRKRERTLYIIRNARLDPDWAQVQRRTLSIAGRAVSSLLQTQGIGDLYQIYLITQRDGFAYNLAFIPRSFTTPLNEPFEQAYMRELFEVGREMALQGYPWEHVPPTFGPRPETAAAAP